VMKRIAIAPTGTRFSPVARSDDGLTYEAGPGVATIEPQLGFTFSTERRVGRTANRVIEFGIPGHRTDELSGSGPRVTQPSSRNSGPARR